MTPSPNPTLVPVGPAAPPSWPATPPPAPPMLDADDPRLGPLDPRPTPAGGPPRTPTPTPTPRAPRRGARGALVVIAALLALVMLGGVGGVVLVRDRGDEHAADAPSSATAPDRSTPSTTAPGSTDPTDPADPTDPTDPSNGRGQPGSGSGANASLDAAVQDIKAFVERDRGLTFTHDVDITVLDDAAFEAAIRAQVEGEQDAMRQQGELLKAAGLLPASFDVIKGQLDLLAAGVLGYYDPKTKALVVRGGAEITPFLREILAHELTHALDDQHFGLDRPELERVTDGRDFAFLAVVEGSAKRVENDYVATFDAQERQQLEQEMLAMGMDQMQTMLEVPMVLPRLQMAPYDYGEPFAKALVAAGGTAALDAAMRDLPTTSEQILVPPKYTNREGSMVVARPDADGNVTQNGTLGQLMTGFLLHGNDSGGLGGLGGLDGLGSGANGEGGGLDGLDGDLLRQLLELLLGGSGDGSGAVPDLGGLGGLGDLGATGFPPIETVAGWGGDHYVVYEQGDQRCLRVDWRMDTPEAHAALDRALHTWAGGDGAVRLAAPSGDTLRATRCSAR